MQNKVRDPRKAVKSLAKKKLKRGMRIVVVVVVVLVVVVVVVLIVKKTKQQLRRMKGN